MIGHVFEAAYVIGLVLGSVVRSVYTVPCKRNAIAKNPKAPLDTIFLVLTGIRVGGGGSPELALPSLPGQPA